MGRLGSKVLNAADASDKYEVFSATGISGNLLDNHWDKDFKPSFIIGTVRPSTVVTLASNINSLLFPCLLEL